MGVVEASKTAVGRTIVPLTVVFVGTSILLCRWTRIYDVVGVSRAPFYGSQRLQKKNILITGANSGIGKETTIQLASMGATIYMLCRCPSRARRAMEDILKDHSPTIRPSQLKVVTIDLGNFQSIRAAVQDQLKDVPIDVLINNAGLMMGRKTLSHDGYELMMQANHLGHFLLTRLLWDQFSKEARILNVTSSTYQLVETGFDFDDIMCESSRTYTLFGQYAQTKLANILFTQELAKRHPDHPIYAIHPGLVRTNVTSNMPWLMQSLNRLFAWFIATMQKLPEQGAYSNVMCAAAPASELPPHGSYIVNCQAQAITPAGSSSDDAERLWTVSEQLVGWTSSSQS